MQFIKKKLSFTPEDAILFSKQLRDRTQKCLDKEDKESIESLSFCLDIYSLLIEVDEFFVSAFKN